MTRNSVLSQACDQCLKELYSIAQPKVTWERFLEENKIYSEKYKDWEKNRNKYPDWKGKSITKCIGPRPYEFYYIPREIMKEICDSYVRAYRMDSQQELLDTIEILKGYCKNPIIDKYIEEELQEDGTRWPGYKGYDHPDNLIQEVKNILVKYDDHMDSEISEEVVNKFFEFLDMAGSFYNWNSELNSFNTTIYLGASPNSNKEAVIDNWKKYRNQNIEIDDDKFREEDDFD